MVLLCQAVGICSRTGIILAGRFSLRIMCIMLGFYSVSVLPSGLCLLPDRPEDRSWYGCLRVLVGNNAGQWYVNLSPTYSNSSNPGLFVRIGLFFMSRDPDQDKIRIRIEKSWSGSMKKRPKIVSTVRYKIKIKLYLTSQTSNTALFWLGSSKTKSKFLPNLLNCLKS